MTTTTPAADLSMAQAMERMRALSVQRFQRGMAEHAARSAAGLVSVSTTCRSWVEFNAQCIEVDHKAARVTRLRKSLGVAAKALHGAGPVNQQVWMQTLTYRGTNADWRAEHISRYLDALRRWHYSKTGNKSVRYAWVAELQQRGTIHYHVIVWLSAGLTPPKPDTPWRRVDARGIAHGEAPMWPHGMSNRLKATAPVAYLMKYASKIETKSVGGFPRGARIHGCGGLSQAGRACRRWVLWPAYVQGNASVNDRFKPTPGGGYLNAETGELLRAEYAPTGGGHTRFVRIRTTPRKITAAGPFSWLTDAPQLLAA